MILRLVQLLNLLFLRYGKLFLFLIKMILEQKQHACKESCHDNGTGRIEIRLGRSIWQYQFRPKIGKIITAQRLQRT